MFCPVGSNLQLSISACKRTFVEYLGDIGLENLPHAIQKGSLLGLQGCWSASQNGRVLFAFRRSTRKLRAAADC
jgi:hypothetical protein